MLFKRSKPEKSAARFPGRPGAADGHAAVFAVESMASDVVVVQSTPDLAEITGPMRKLAPAADEGSYTPPASVHSADDAAGAAARTTGASAAGLRASAMVNRLGDIHASLSAAVGKRLTSVYHLTCRALPRQAGALHGSHDDYFAASDVGMFQFFARDVQEAADFTLIAHRVAERALTPGVVAQDYYRTSHSVQAVNLPEAELVGEFLGRAGDTIDCPTPSQQVLYGDTRRRVPRAVDPDHPAGTGGLQDAESYFKAMAAQRTYFAEHLSEIIAAELAQYAALTGRSYKEVSGYRVDDADFVILAQGAVVDEVEAVAGYMRDHENIKVGVINLSVFRPFPGAALTRLLRGKRAVTILERTDRPLSESLPLCAEVRAAVDKAVENGGAGETLHRDHDIYRAGDRPRILTGVYGVGGELPSFGELVAVCRNMAAKAPKPMVYLGLGEDTTIRRFPHLHSLQQSLNRDYPSRNETVLPAADVTAPIPDAHSMRLYSLSVQGGIFAGNLFAQTLAEETTAGVRTFPRGGLEPTSQPATFTLVHAPDGSAPAGLPRTVDIALVAGGRLIEDVSSRDDLVMGGILVVETNCDADSLWKGLSRRTARWIQERELRVYTIDAARIAAETASQPSFVDQLAVWALLGAYASLRLDDDTIAVVTDGLRSRLARLFDDDHYLINDIVGALRRGAAELKQLDVSSRGTEGLAAASDGEAPWTVKEASGWNDTVFDATRFWHSVGYLYDSGQSDRALADPYLATGVIPARSSAFRDMSPYRLRIPEWLPENCTGCGLCWAQCPDSALPPSIDSVAAVVETSMTLAESAGVGLVQMKRFADHLVKQAYRLVARDGMSRYLRVGVLLDDAFAQLIDKLGLDEEKQKLLEDEFAHVRVHAEHFAFAKTETFFDSPHETEKGTGTLLSIALNPLACTGCGVCIDVCPEGALEWADQTPERLARSRENWNFQAELPQTDVEDIEHFVTADSATHVNRLLDRSAYHSLVGGDGSYPGNSAKIAVRLTAGAIETVMTARFDEHVMRLSDLIDRLQRKIQGDVSDVLKINDFDEFSKRLDQFDKGALTPDTLASAMGGDAGSTLDPDHLRRLTHLLDSLREQRRLYLDGADGTGRARMTMTIDSDAVRLWSGMYPYNPLPYPWVCHVPGDGIQLAGGVQDGLARRVSEEIAVCRVAELELDGDYDEKTLAAFGPDDLTDAERRLIPPTIVLGEVGTTSWDDIARLLAGKTPVRLLLINTSGTDVDAGDAGVSIEANLVSMARGNPAAYAAQLSVGYPGHLIQRVAEGMNHDGPSVFHVLAPDPIRNGIAPEKTAAQARLAVEARAFVLFTVSNGALSVEGNPAADNAWLAREMEFHEPSGKESTVETAMTVADWAIGEARFETHFRIVAKGELSEHMVTLDEYIALDGEAREGKEPYIHFADKNQRHFLAIVSPEMVRATDACHDLWRWLRHEAEPIVVESPLPVVAADTTETVEAPAPGAADASVHEALTERLLKLSGFRDDPEFFKQSLREFVVERNLEAGGSDDDAPLPQ